ncbi:LLM class flavin-dependent oxidoreductase [Paenibacillus sp. GCM10012307]|uniref:LLM class flavin-dependent oxidoreductase n=1 Tax=Paenibacillus roseus TaxID=2798579 RepID=A0A934J4E4_9BACL|nr:LLM class flavin-dependent oxidoreductase [Paenibacillus roseus]MBJ6360215.1 LLM class flavin-dependent oxidoreductase [Paenibacillus roseus]
MSAARQIKIGLYTVGTGMHIGSWRLPQAQADASIDVDFYKKIALEAERGLLDAVFIADSLAIDENSHSQILNRFDPTVLITAIAGATKHIGVVATASTTYNEPYNLARQFSSVDIISGGRAGWNVVTTADATGLTALNYSRKEHVLHDDRYKIAEEFIDVVKGLWDSWEEDAFIRNKETGQFYDPDKVHLLNYEGEFFQVRGPLNIGRTPQGHPVLFQAGASLPGQELAARTAEAIFSHKKSFEDARSYYQELKGRMAKYGRKENELLILQGISPIIGRTQEEADEKADKLEATVIQEQALRFLSGYVGNVDLTSYSLDTPATEVAWREVNSIQSDYELIQKIIREENLTVGELYTRISNVATNRSLRGTPEQVADTLTYWFENGACDGFIFIPPALPDSLTDFVDLVVPILQERGIYRTEYTGTTLREHLGLAIPENRYTKQRLDASHAL